MNELPFCGGLSTIVDDVFVVIVVVVAVVVIVVVAVVFTDVF